MGGVTPQRLTIQGSYRGTWRLGVTTTLCAPGRGRPTWIAPFSKHIWLCQRREKAVLTLFLTHRWLPGAGTWAAVASGRGAGCVLFPGGRDPSEALGLREQAVARGASLAWGFMDLPFPSTPEAGVTVRAGPSVPHIQ